MSNNDLKSKIRAMMEDGTNPRDIVVALGIIMVEEAMNITRDHDQRTGSPAEIKNLLCTLIQGYVDIAAEENPELFCIRQNAA